MSQCVFLPSLKSVNAIFLNAHLKVPSWGCTLGWNPYWTSISFFLCHWVFTNYSSNTYSNYILKVPKIEEMFCINRSKKKYFTLWSSSGRILKVSFQCATIAFHPTLNPTYQAEMIWMVCWSSINLFKKIQRC